MTKENEIAKECDICKLINIGDNDIKFYKWKKNWYTTKDNHICAKCLGDIKKLREMCHRKIDNPKKDIFKDWRPSFVEELPGKALVEKK